MGIVVNNLPKKSGGGGITINGAIEKVAKVLKTTSTGDLGNYIEGVEISENTFSSDGVGYANLGNRYKIDSYPSDHMSLAYLEQDEEWFYIVGMRTQVSAQSCGVHLFKVNKISNYVVYLDVWGYGTSLFTSLANVREGVVIGTKTVTKDSKYIDVLKISRNVDGINLDITRYDEPIATAYVDAQVLKISDDRVLMCYYDTSYKMNLVIVGYDGDNFTYGTSYLTDIVDTSSGDTKITKLNNNYTAITIRSNVRVINHTNDVLSISDGVAGIYDTYWQDVVRITDDVFVNCGGLGDNVFYIKVYKNTNGVVTLLKDNSLDATSTYILGSSYYDGKLVVWVDINDKRRIRVYDVDVTNGDVTMISESYDWVWGATELLRGIIEISNHRYMMFYGDGETAGHAYIETMSFVKGYNAIALEDGNVDDTIKVMCWEDV